MNAHSAITVTGIAKAYRVGVRQESADTLVGALKATLSSPVRNFRYLYGLSRAHKYSDEHRVWALQDVSFEVAQGEVVAIVGRNGAGKSTLLKILSRITDPTRGEAVIRGRVSSLLEVGTGFHPELTGRENIYMNATILGMTKSEIDRKFDQIVEFSGVENFLDTPIKRFSSGMQVRLAFSVAAHLEPEILIVDEVLAVGDIEFQKRCIGKMQEVASGGRTVLFVSHNLAAIGQLCTSGILLTGGRVTAQGNLHDVVQSYMEDLFKTQSEVGDESIQIAVSTAVDGDPAEQTWNYGSELTVRIHVRSQELIPRPAVDLYFYSSAGRMIFAQSDHFIDSALRSDNRDPTFEFTFRNNGFASDFLTLDVGLRHSSSTRNLRLWRSLTAVALGPLPSGFTQGRDCPIAVPCHVAMHNTEMSMQPV
jgi:lipopolysaccharide transport system ATP-binding protein